MGNCKPLSTSGFGAVEQLEEHLLHAEETQRFQAITGSVMYLAQVTRYDIMYSTCQLDRAVSKPSKVHMGAAKHIMRHLAGSPEFSIVYKKEGSSPPYFRTPTGAIIRTTASRRRATSS